MMPLNDSIDDTDNDTTTNDITFFNNGYQCHEDGQRSDIMMTIDTTTTSNDDDGTRRTKRTIDDINSSDDLSWH